MLDGKPIPYPPQTAVIFAISNSIKYGVVLEVHHTIKTNGTEIEYIIESLDDAGQKVKYSIYDLKKIKISIENCQCLLKSLQSYIVHNKEDLF